MSENTKVLLLFNNKGGVGKTNITINLCEILGSVYKKRVLAIDNDAQNSLSFLCNVPVNEDGALEAEEGHPDLGYLIGNIQWEGMSAIPEYEDLADAIIRPSYKINSRVPHSTRWETKNVDFSFDLLPGYNKDLSIVEMLYVAPTDEPFILQGDNRKYARYLLKLVVDQIKKYFDYDYIIIDCPPSLGILSINALLAGDSLILPTTPDMLSTIGISNIIDNLNDLHLYVPNFTVLGTVFNMYSGTKGDDAIIEDVKEYGVENNINVFKTRIPRVNKMKQVSSEENIAVNVNEKQFRMYRESIISLAKEIIDLTEGAEE